ncbi:MAG: antitoxin VapB family protein [Candidatus Lokiarchaeota archaeon]|nr:antitoxin VapB family protein [Candidatus Lokiarchaeota archaeon]
MTSVQISIKKDLQDRLKAIKGDDESYSDVIERLLEGQGNLQEFIKCHGIARGDNEAEVHEAYAEARKTIREGMRARLDLAGKKGAP